jgi:hypothetical protein
MFVLHQHIVGLLASIKPLSDSPPDPFHQKTIALYDISHSLNGKKALRAHYLALDLFEIAFSCSFSFALRAFIAK